MSQVATRDRHRSPGCSGASGACSGLASPGVVQSTLPGSWCRRCLRGRGCRPAPGREPIYHWTSNEHPCSDAARREGLEPPTARSVGWCSASTECWRCCLCSSRQVPSPASHKMCRLVMAGGLPLGLPPTRVGASDYESKRTRPAGVIPTRSCCSRQPARPSSAFLTGGVTAGGMTTSMTSLTTAVPPDRTQPSDTSSERYRSARTSAGSADWRPIMAPVSVPPGAARPTGGSSPPGSGGVRRASS